MAKKQQDYVGKDNKKYYYVFSRNIYIYPISEFCYKQKTMGINDYLCISNKLWYIEVNNNGVIKTYKKIIKEAEIENAIWATINHYYKLLTEK